MLLVLMYHKINEPNCAARLPQFHAHLKYLVENFPIIAPGAKLNNQLSICLTFDDAYCDFYNDIYPLLQQYQIPAVLGITTKYTLDNTDLPMAKRLAVPYPTGMDAGIYDTHAPLCTWEEINEMVASNLVVPASHSHTHADLKNPNSDLAQEGELSKHILQEKLTTNIDTFIYPFGKMNKSVHKHLSKHYKYLMRIGGSVNHDWSQLIYRVDADHLWPNNIQITAKFLKSLKWKYWLNKIRGK